MTLYVKIAATNCSILSQSDMSRSDNTAILQNIFFYKFINLEINKNLNLYSKGMYNVMQINFK